MGNIWYIENVDVYSLLCPHKLAAYREQHEFAVYAAGQVIYLEYDTAQTLYLIAEGSVKILTYSPDGEERIKSILSTGEVFGEMALFGAEQRKECAVALKNNTLLCPLRVETLHELMREYKPLSVWVYKRIGWKMKKIERRIELLLFKDAPTRLREFLKDLALESGVAQGNDTLVRHPYTQQNIADLIGVTRSTLNILLSELRNTGEIDFKRGEILLKNFSLPKANVR
jgi:CRP-like cAMP-binding protein